MADRSGADKDSAPPTPVRFADVLANRQFLLLWLAQFVSAFGDWLAILALFSLIGFRWKGSADQVAGLIMALLLPWAVLGPVAGVFVDRWSLKPTMITSDLIRAVLAGLFVLATEPWHLYLLVASLSAVSCFFLPAQNAAIPRLVRREELLVANSLNAQTIQINRIVSPAVAGVLVAWAGERICFYLDAVSFVLSAALLSRISLAGGKQDAPRGVRAVLGELRAGLRYLAGHRLLRFATVAMVAAVFIIGAFDALIVVYVRDVLHAGSALFGGLVALVGAGTILGAALTARYGQRLRKIDLITGGILGIGVGIFLLALATHAVAAVLCGFGLGLAVSLVNVPAQTLVQEETTQEMLGRVGSTSGALMTVAQLVGISIAGQLAAWMGIRRLYFLLAVSLVLVAVAGHRYSRANRIDIASASPPHV